MSSLVYQYGIMYLSVIKNIIVGKHKYIRPSLFRGGAEQHALSIIGALCIGAEVTAE